MPAVLPSKAIPIWLPWRMRMCGPTGLTVVLRLWLMTFFLSAPTSLSRPLMLSSPTPPSVPRIAEKPAPMRGVTQRGMRRPPDWLISWQLPSIWSSLPEEYISSTTRHGWQNLSAAHAELKLAVLRLRMVHGTAQTVAKMFLVELAKGSRGDVTVEPPLIVYGDSGEYTAEAAAILGG